MKVDCQAVMGITGGGAPDLNGGPAISAEYHAALERSISQNFPGNNCINCMCHSTEDIYRWPPPPPRPGLVAMLGGPIACLTCKGKLRRWFEAARQFSHGKKPGLLRIWMKPALV